MSKQFNPVLQQRLEEFIEALGGKDGGQTKASAIIGYSTGTLSTYRDSKYNGNIAKVESRLKEVFDNQEEAATLRLPTHYVKTSISNEVYETIRLCHMRGGFSIECGDAGIGKTMAAKQYIKDFPDTSFYVSTSPFATTTTAFLRFLCREFGLDTGRQDDMAFQIKTYLKRGAKVLIIDEAQRLPHRTIDDIRQFYDENEEVGIMLIGNPKIVEIRNEKNKDIFAQVNNRTKLTEIRRRTHITKEDMNLLIPDLSKNGKEIELLHIIAQSEQGVRGAINLYRNALNNENITYEGLLAMAKSMKIVMF